jgi:3-oxoacyl-[acyl-carrier protein] reductase
MDLGIKDQLFVVGGATSGFGRAIAESLAIEGANVIAIARSTQQLNELQLQHPGRIEILGADITDPETKSKLLSQIGTRSLHGLLMNAGGPPAITALDATMENWDNAYRSVFRWKIDLMQSLLPLMIKNQYGRIVFIESASVKQPMENLVLSTSMRLAVVGYVKSISQEVGREGVTVNVLAPGSHDTAAMERVINKKIEKAGVSRDEAVKGFIDQTSVGFLGRSGDFASLATWLLSGHSRYITGQTISVDGGSVRGVMG